MPKSNSSNSEKMNPYQKMFAKVWSFHSDYIKWLHQAGNKSAERQHDLQIDTELLEEIPPTAEMLDQRNVTSTAAYMTANAMSRLMNAKTRTHEEKDKILSYGQHVEEALIKQHLYCIRHSLIFKPNTPSLQECMSIKEMAGDVHDLTQVYTEYFASLPKR